MKLVSKACEFFAHNLSEMKLTFVNYLWYRSHESSKASLARRRVGGRVCREQGVAFRRGRRFIACVGPTLLLGTQS